MLGLRSLGLHVGDRISLLTENRVEALCLDLATTAAGLVLVNNRPVYSDRSVATIQSQPGNCRVVQTRADHADGARTARRFA